jgi:hypothetical protein
MKAIFCMTCVALSYGAVIGYFLAQWINAEPETPIDDYEELRSEFIRSHCNPEIREELRQK